MEKIAQRFEFSGYSADLKTGQFIFTYTVYMTSGDTQVFTEKLLLPPVPVGRVVPPQLLDSVLHSLHLALGVTYWKLYCPPVISIKTTSLTQYQAEFWNTVYTKGLGEFFFKNNIKYQGLIKFPAESAVPSAPTPITLQERAVVGIGGGKDSIVVHELLKEKNYPHTGLVVEIQRPQPLISNVLHAMNLEALKPKRLIDPRLFQLNKEKNTFNGHVPVSAINALIGVLTALLFDYKYFIVGNEHSSDIGNVEWQGEIVNHQWSKSVEFEKFFQNYLQTVISPDLKYFSLLRPWYEIKIVEKFSKYQQYFSFFSSCNTNFKITNLQSQLWCGQCAKCCFIFALLGAFLPQQTLIPIFGKNMFADEKLLPLFRQILGVEGFKPFDCVGTPEETKVAFYLIHAKGEYKGDVVMKMFETEILPRLANIEKLKQEVFGLHDTSCMPEQFRTFVQ